MITTFLPELYARGFNILFTSPVNELSPSLLSHFDDEEKTKSIIILGSGGKILWDKIEDLKIKDPIDSHSLMTLRWLIEVAHLKNADIYYPLTNRTLPLQQFGRHFSFSTQSPIGLDFSEEFGLWFSYRGVLLTETRLKSNKNGPKIFACEDCSERPCLKETNLDLARLACPEKIEHQYSKEQQDYHFKVRKLLIS